MAGQVNLIPASNVEGNITSCKIENQVKSVQKDSATSIQQTTIYMTYDVCNKNTIAEYRVPEFTTYSVFVLGAVLSLVFVFWFVAALIRDY